ncbi:DUF2059 domain-containing protein [Sphingomonas psychrotolerans]|nr:DUF2059 domain-containing protein [Sphingomonas psychrotolerans]
MLRSLAIAAALAACFSNGSAQAQAAPSAVAAPEPARLAAATALMERVMPADRRDAMVEQMVRPMMQNVRDTMFNGPLFADAKTENPKLVATFEGFMKDEFERSIAALKTSMPAMFDAMARAYARRFTLDQLQALDTFFQTPAGRAYVELAPTIMTDPDLMAVQRSMMTETIAGMQQRMVALTDKLAAEAKKSD